MTRTRGAAKIALFFACSYLFGIVDFSSTQGQEPRKAPDLSKRLPKPGIVVPPEKRQSLEAELTRLETRIAQLQRRTDARTQLRLPDLIIFSHAVRTALTHNEFFQANELDKAAKLLKEGHARAEALEKNLTPWTTQTGLITRGFVSGLDDTVQPYGLIVPDAYAPKGNGSSRYRLDIWLHGRGEMLSEVNFLDERMRSPGTFAPEGTFVLHPYGRYCNAFKLAGETDVLEAVEAVKAAYPIDPDRISVRGFSMGGAGAWHLAVHHAGRWFAANPGAGFSESTLFLNGKRKTPLTFSKFEKILFRWYDCPPYCENLVLCPTVAYSGDQDPQKQAADVMSAALADHGIPLTHVIGPKTQHKYEPGAAKIVDEKLASIAVPGRDRFPAHVRMVTYTLTYPEQSWVRIEGLGKHWERASVDATRVSPSRAEVRTENVTALTLNFPAGYAPWAPGKPVVIVINNTTLNAPPPATDRSWSFSAVQEGGSWKAAPAGWSPVDPLRKNTATHGPIDHAFLDAFLFVLPSGKSTDTAVDQWVKDESAYAQERWRRHFRGAARVKLDKDVTPEDHQKYNIVLWGTPASNLVLGKIADKLPVRWTKDAITLSYTKNNANSNSSTPKDATYASTRHALILIAPNPLNPHRYVVLNSGFTYRDGHDYNNALQTPKLPDWAIVDVTTPPDDLAPGKIVAADFFDEIWGLRHPD